jgi:predicted nuclease of predicted toxin-antitoxin system
VKVLLDENLPHKLRSSLAHHEVMTVAHLGWSGLKNGDLLEVAEASGIEVFVTGDRALTYQQNVTGRKMGIVTLSAHNWPIIKHYLSEIARAVDDAVPGSFKIVACGSFERVRRGRRIHEH